jgi:hypothetical protein
MRRTISHSGRFVKGLAEIWGKRLAAGGLPAAREKNETGKLQIADDIGEDIPDARTEQDQDDDNHECD